MTISMPIGHVAEEYDWDAESGGVGELPEWRLVVAPARGIFHAPEAAGNSRTAEEGHTLDLGHIEARRDRQVIVAPWRGAVIEWLVQDGDPVALGQPVARLLPDGLADGLADDLTDGLPDGLTDGLPGHTADGAE